MADGCIASGLMKARVYSSRDESSRVSAAFSSDEDCDRLREAEAVAVAPEAPPVEVVAV